MATIQFANDNLKVAIIGCGNMGAAIAERLCKHASILLYDRNLDKMQKLEDFQYGKISSSIEEVLATADIVVLAIKPQNIEASATDIDKFLKPHQILISLLAGTTLKRLEDLFPNVSTIVRMMPNIAIKLGEGIAAFSCSLNQPQEFKDGLINLFSPLGHIFWIDENKIDAISSLAGSGPAFIFTFIEAMIEASIAMGLSAKDALPLVLQTMQGSIALLKEGNSTPSSLKWQVTSPAGTTIFGLRQLEKSNVRSGIIETFLSTFERNKQL